MCTQHHLQSCQCVDEHGVGDCGRQKWELKEPGSCSGLASAMPGAVGADTFRNWPQIVLFGPWRRSCHSATGCFGVTIAAQQHVPIDAMQQDAVAACAAAGAIIEPDAPGLAP